MASKVLGPVGKVTATLAVAAVVSPAKAGLVAVVGLPLAGVTVCLIVLPTDVTH